MATKSFFLNPLFQISFPTIHVKMLQVSGSQAGLITIIIWEAY